MGRTVALARIWAQFRWRWTQRRAQVLVAQFSQFAAAQQRCVQKAALVAVAAALLRIEEAADVAAAARGLAAASAATASGAAVAGHVLGSPGRARHVMAAGLVVGLLAAVRWTSSQRGSSALPRGTRASSRHAIRRVARLAVRLALRSRHSQSCRCVHLPSVRPCKPANVGAAAARGAEAVDIADTARQCTTNSARPGRPAAAGAKPSRPRLLLAALRGRARPRIAAARATAGGGAIF